MSNVISYILILDRICHLEVEVEVDSTTESNAEQPGDSTIKLKFLDDTEKVVKTKLSATIIEFKKFVFSYIIFVQKQISEQILHLRLRVEKQSD